MVIDLNADLGEGGKHDEALLQLISSANIACGFHAGDAQTMHRSVRSAIKYGVTIGAHPGYPDREHFGRRALQLTPDVVFAQVVYQVGALAALVKAEGARMFHVKPHGMLYNQAAKDPQLADAIARAVKVVDPLLHLVGLAGSELINAGKRYGLKTREEVFADRSYQADGTLVPRDQSSALITSDELALAQTLEMIQRQRVRATDGSWVPVKADTVCLHGDGEHALQFASKLHHSFAQYGIYIAAC
ncbi:MULTISPECIES: 5-oxoprolinase subunit PxpA [Lonsdalea]|uniref:Lactam utilization protein LamB n=2 Tax=Lonsdalea TaxID=1082702 RepID=A0ACD1JAI3_9GAMM|nr:MULTISPECIES: 5-oxoprolinase subunit PxpA [Lonsdalea]OSM96400.1 lactam utilization protein LamB [Lonsdalea populi]OSN02053.1 lactam utilization protein LamB [Lonsdalea populi]QPQ25241.1 5-oxoprolinase subunit PxpA [Lonsdalea populi]RAT12300.1 lactam utilization protein LamB [Lonsdalea quercina]RAT17340.1 lactam utilization protein LamB [Lonsdalea quercina]